MPRLAPLTSLSLCPLGLAYHALAQKVYAHHILMVLGPFLTAALLLEARHCTCSPYSLPMEFRSGFHHCLGSPSLPTHLSYRSPALLAIQPSVLALRKSLVLQCVLKHACMTNTVLQCPAESVQGCSTSHCVSSSSLLVGLWPDCCGNSEMCDVCRLESLKGWSVKWISCSVCCRVLQPSWSQVIRLLR